MSIPLTTFLRGFSPNAPRPGEREKIVLAAERLEQLMAAISWVLPPFVDEDTPEAELRKRVRYLVEDATRHLDLSDPKPMGRKPRVVYDMQQPPLLRTGQTLPDTPSNVTGAGI